jgi:uncharacterized protein
MPRACPICKRAIPDEALEAPHRPFCSSRCRTIDLGSWLTESYRISSPVAEEDLDEGSPLGPQPDAGDERQKRN